MSTRRDDMAAARLEARLAALEQSYARKLDELEHEIAALRARPSSGKAMTVGSEASKMSETSNGAAPKPERSSRRALLRGALGAATATVGAAALLDATTKPAAASNGNVILAGNVATAEANTTVLYDGSPFRGVVLLGNDSTYTGSSASFPAALGGWAGAGSTAGKGGVAHGVYGYTDNGNGNGVVGVNSNNVPGTGAGVFGSANSAGGAGVAGINFGGTGVIGSSSGGTGVSGATGSGTGVSGASTSGAGVSGTSTSGIGVSGTSSSSTGVSGSSDSTAGSATAIVGTITSTSPGGFSSAVRGINNGTGGNGIGVYGSQAGGGWGVYGTSVSGIGGNFSGGSGVGVLGSGDTGVAANGNTTGVSASSSGGTGVIASSSSGTGVNASSNSGTALVATSSSGIGISGTSNGAHSGVTGTSSGANGVFGTSTAAVGVDAAGVKGTSTNGYGAFFQGGLAPIRLAPASTAGAPSSGSHHQGELFVDKNGVLYFCTVSGTPGTWKRVTLT